MAPEQTGMAFTSAVLCSRWWQVTHLLCPSGHDTLITNVHEHAIGFYDKRKKLYRAAWIYLFPRRVCWGCLLARYLTSQKYIYVSLRGEVNQPLITLSFDSHLFSCDCLYVCLCLWNVHIQQLLFMCFNPQKSRLLVCFLNERLAWFRSKWNAILNTVPMWVKDNLHCCLDCLTLI